MNTPEAIYRKILNQDIKIEKGIISLIEFLQKYDNDDSIYEIKEILIKLSKNYINIYDTFIKIYNNSEKPVARLFIAQLLIITFPEKCIKFIQDQIKRESSALFLSFLYIFLNSQRSEIFKTLKYNLIKKYEKIYDIDYKECPFLIELENTQTNKEKNLDISTGYFKKFETDDINTLENSSFYNYVVKNHHILALDLRRWEITEIPDSICLLKDLMYLNLSHLRLSSLPESMGTLLKLKHINLSDNEITELPNWIVEIARNKVSKNYLKEGVAPSNALILALIEILIGEKVNKVEQTRNVIDWEIALDYKINKEGYIIGLYLKNEKLKLSIFPVQICLLKFLEELEIPDSSIQKLPECIGNLKSLRYLNLFNNRIKIIPRTIENLTNLEYLDLDDNDVTESVLLDLRWYKIGQRALEIGNFNNAINELKKTLEVYPKNKYAWYHLGIAYKEFGNIPKAEKAFKTFLEIDKKNSLVWSELSEIYHSKKDYINAIDAIKHAIDLEPDTAVLYSNLGFNYKKLGKYDEAIKEYSRSLEISSDNVYLWRDLASIYREQGEILKAIDAEYHATELELKKSKKE
jgi:Leucine-rich repeat (LRR) protein